MKNEELRNNVRRPKGKPMKNEEWRFVRFVWFVFKKYIRVFFQNPSQIPFALSRYNQKKNQTKIQKKKSQKRIRVKTPKKIGDTPWAFFDLSSVAAGLQSAMQQYYLPTIYVIRRRTGRSLAIVRSVSLRLQDEGQKKLTEYHRCTRSLWHGFFWPLFLCIGIINGFASVTACGCLGSDCPLICRYLVTYIALRKASAATCKIRLKSPCPAKVQSKDKSKNESV